MQMIDLSHTLEPDISLFSPKAPPPQITAWMSHEESAATGIYQGCTCEITHVAFVTSCGTYLDSPFHFHPDRSSIEALDLTQLILPGIVIDCTGIKSKAPITPDFLSDQDISGKAVLFHTGLSAAWKQPEYHTFPFLSLATARCLVDGGAKLAGVDCLVVDDPTDPQRPAHTTLLGSDVLIVENLTNLAQLPQQDFTFHAVPLKVKGAAAFPVRAYATIP